MKILVVKAKKVEARRKKTSEGKKNEIEKPVEETIEVFTTFFTIKKW
jgi:hypothetical protein